MRPDFNKDPKFDWPITHSPSGRTGGYCEGGLSQSGFLWLIEPGTGGSRTNHSGNDGVNQTFKSIETNATSHNETQRRSSRRRGCRGSDWRTARCRRGCTNYRPASHGWNLPKALAGPFANRLNTPRTSPNTVGRRCPPCHKAHTRSAQRIPPDSCNNHHC